MGIAWDDSPMPIDNYPDLPSDRIHITLTKDDARATVSTPDGPLFVIDGVDDLPVYTLDSEGTYQWAGFGNPCICVVSLTDDGDERVVAVTFDATTAGYLGALSWIMAKIAQAT